MQIFAQMYNCILSMMKYVSGETAEELYRLQNAVANNAGFNEIPLLSFQLHGRIRGQNWDEERDIQPVDFMVRVSGGEIVRDDFRGSYTPVASRIGLELVYDEQHRVVASINYPLQKVDEMGLDLNPIFVVNSAYTAESGEQTAVETEQVVRDIGLISQRLARPWKHSVESVGDVFIQM